MWPVNVPSVSAGEAVEACAKGTRDKSLRQRLRRSRSDLEANSQAYRQAALDMSLHAITADDFAVGELESAEMIWLYKQQLSKQGRPARKLYDELVARAPFGLCCYCQYGQAKTLDHFVPKSTVARLAIDPWNLVPACEQCNHKLLSIWGVTAEEQLLHPYAMPDLGRWLRATVLRTAPASLEFSVSSSNELDITLQARMLHEFEVLGLAEMYSVVSAADIEIVSRTLSREFLGSASTVISSYLREVAADAFAVDANSRRGVVLEALGDDDWFCSGGYREGQGEAAK